MIALPFSATKIVVDYKAGHVYVEVDCGCGEIWTRTVPKHETEKLRRWVSESELSMAVQRKIDQRICDIEDQIIDEDAAKSWNRDEVVFWIVMVVCTVAVVGAAWVVWNY